MKPSDNYTGSIIKFFLDTLNITGVFGTLPSGFPTPSVYFPELDFNSDNDTLNSFRQDMTWYIKVFGKDSDEAYQLAKKAVVAINQHRNKIPIFNKSNEKTGINLKIKASEAKKIDTGVYQITVKWTHREYYSDVFNDNLIKNINISQIKKP